MLIAAMLTMGLTTFAVGCLPTYQQIGILAPTALVILRILQGVGLGGEWGGAVILVMEHGTKERRGFYGSLVQTGFPVGLVAASLAFAAVARLREAQFLSSGWRLPFLASILLVALGYYVRKTVAESPIFERLKEARELSRLPVVEAIRGNTRSFLVSAGLKDSPMPSRNNHNPNASDPNTPRICRSLPPCRRALRTTLQLSSAAVNPLIMTR